ncbi:MAG: PQQ-binding-like beta-propeller repeat protein [Ginsengibacter sp.]
MKKLLTFSAFLFFIQLSFAQDRGLIYVHLSDTHVGSTTGADDLRRTVHDINSLDDIQFVIITGDITEFGADDEIKLAKQILDSLNRPWHIIPGNHDGNWSESGANTFKKVFGNETFSFMTGGYLFLGTHSGPNMRMSPGQIPRENIVWLDSVVTATPENTPIIFANHYPQDSSLNNWFEAIDVLKTKNIQLIMCGHLHSNRQMNFEGIPGIVGRSNLRAKNYEGGYNIVTIKDNTLTYTERNPVSKNQKQWAQTSLINHHFKNDTTHYYRPSYAVNATYASVKTHWQFADNSDIGSGVALTKKLVIASNTGGLIYALNKKTGKKTWSFQTGGKIYSTPAIENNLVVVASTDNSIYCLKASDGKMIWKFETQKPIVANPLIKNNTVYIGASDGHFRAINLQTGKLIWDFDSVKNFVVTTPLFYNNKIYFGSWGNEFYALDAASGKQEWKWSNGHANRMLSSAACYPVATKGRIFMVAPDRYMTVLDAQTGQGIWRKHDPEYRVRESMGLSKDSAIVYAKTMDGFVIGVSTGANEMEIPWRSDTQLNYEIAPTAIVEIDNVVYVPSNSGIVTAVNRKDGSVIWKHKVSNSLITNITPVSKNKVIVTTMDGKVSCLVYLPQ